MFGYVIRRLAMALATVFAAIVISFLLVHLSPGSPGAIVAGADATEAEIAKANAELGWDQPLWTQLTAYLGNLLQGDMGRSIIDGQSIQADLLTRLPVTFFIALFATILSAVVGVVLGVTAAVRGGHTDRGITVGSGIALSLPAFWVGVLLVYVIAVRAGLLPATGYVPFTVDPVGWLQSLLLPVITLAVGGAAVVARTARAGMRGALRQEHIRTLQAVGTPPWRIRYLHALRYASVPIVSVLGIQFIVLFGGSVIIENLFALPGLGQASQSAVAAHDFPALQGVVIVATLVVVVTNLLLDLVIAALDPKVRTA